MNEERYGYRVRQALNHGLKDVPPAAARRLEAARHLALSRQKQTVPELVVAGTGMRSGTSGPQGTPYLKQALAALALLVGMWISFYWHSAQYVSELEEVDSALLTDDLPPDAFLDNDIFKWLLDDSLED